MVACSIDSLNLTSYLLFSLLIYMTYSSTYRSILQSHLSSEIPIHTFVQIYNQPKFLKKLRAPRTHLHSEWALSTKKLPQRAWQLTELHLYSNHTRPDKHFEMHMMGRSTLSSDFTVVLAVFQLPGSWLSWEPTLCGLIGSTLHVVSKP